MLKKFLRAKDLLSIENIGVTFEPIDEHKDFDGVLLINNIEYAFVNVSNGSYCLLKPMKSSNLVDMLKGRLNSFQQICLLELNNKHRVKRRV